MVNCESELYTTPISRREEFTFVKSVLRKNKIPYKTTEGTSKASDATGYRYIILVKESDVSRAAQIVLDALDERENERGNN